MGLPRRVLLPAAFVALLVALAVAAFSLWALSAYQGYAGNQVILVIPEGATARAAADVLQEAGVVRSAGVFRLILQLSGSAELLQAGEYLFSGPIGPLEVRRKLLVGAVLLHQVTVPEGLRMEEIFDLFVSRGLGTAEGFRQASLAVDLVEALDPGAVNLEGYLYPDTYTVPRTVSERDIVAGMVRRFREVFDDEEADRARELGLTPSQAITLASMVEREVSVAEERGLVASVFHNRLRRGMLLQCDPTVIYALIREGIYKGRLTRKGLRFDSPYNTYLYPGLPPGPIANPGGDSLHAALYPAETDYLYFVSMNTGRHQFSRNLDEHRKAVNRYQR